jgi:hypothetical protein
MESQKLGFAGSLLAVCGILVTSFSLSWGLWSDVHPVGHYINEHPIYIAVTGIGLLCSLGVNVSLSKRIAALEGTQSRMNGEAL